MSAAEGAEIVIGPPPPGFDRWDELLALIQGSFAYMDGRIDPPSSAHRLTPESLREKAADEVLLIATAGGQIAGCVFAAERPDCFYIGKLAIAPRLQRAGLGRRLVEAVEALARSADKTALELQTRVELTSNHAAFARMGFVETGRSAHEGFDRPTSITMRKQLVPAAAV